MAGQPGVTVVGETELLSTMARAEKALPDLDTSDAATVILHAIPGTAPRLTGRLAGSFRTGTKDKRATITSPLVYAVPIHWGRPAHNIDANPFVVRAINQTETEWLHALEKSGQKICDGVKGA
jgi:hypothetical protein